MNAADVLWSAARSLRSRGRRTLLCLLGISIGVAAVLVLTGMGDGARSFLRAQFEFIGSDVVGIIPGKVETSGGIPGMGGGVPNDLTLADARTLARNLPHVQRVAPVVIGNETISYGERSRQVMLFGSTTEILPIRRLEVRSGRFLPDRPWERAAPVAVLGAAIASELFPGQNPVGAVIRVGGWRMRVHGVLALQGVHFGVNLDETVFLPAATALQLFDRTSLFRIVLQVRPGRSIDRVKERSAAILRERHGEEDFTITTPDAIMTAMDSILGVLTLALVGIAAISLAVAGIGIMNVMLVSVSERTEEIGVMKAVGAAPGQVLTLFLTEAVMLSTLGGAVGLGIGYGLLHGAGLLLPAFPFHAPTWAAAMAFGVSIVVGVLFGSWPAARAVRLDPVTALAGRAR